MKKVLSAFIVLSLFFLFSCGGEKKEEEPNGCVDCYPECTVKSYGSASQTSDEDFFDQCVYESENSSFCYKEVPDFDAKELFSDLTRMTFVFQKECYQRPFGEVLCPDFIPDSITLANAQLTGCSVEVDYWCYYCPSFYFSTDNELFKVVSFQSKFKIEKPFYANGSVGSNNVEKEVSMNIDYKDFSGYAEFRKPGYQYSLSLPVKILVDGIPAKEEEKPENTSRYKTCRDKDDFSGREYLHGERIAHGCIRLYCNDGAWDENSELCYYGCITGSEAKWMCNDKKTEVEWCECVENRWDCVNRADFACPD